MPVAPNSLLRLPPRPSLKRLPPIHRRRLRSHGIRALALLRCSPDQGSKPSAKADDNSAKPTRDKPADASAKPVAGNDKPVANNDKPAAGTPAVIPVRREGILFSDMGEQPVMHQPARLGGDHGRVHLVCAGDHLVLILIRLHGKHLRAGSTDDFYIDLLLIQQRQDLNHRCHCAGTLVPITAPPAGQVGIIIADNVSAPGSLKVGGYTQFSRSGIVMGGRVRCRATIGTSVARAAPSNTGTSLCS